MQSDSCVSQNFASVKSVVQLPLLVLCFTLVSVFSPPPVAGAQTHRTELAHTVLVVMGSKPLKPVCAALLLTAKPGADNPCAGVYTEVFLYLIVFNFL